VLHRTTMDIARGEAAQNNTQTTIVGKKRPGIPLDSLGTAPDQAPRSSSFPGKRPRLSPSSIIPLDSDSDGKCNGKSDYSQRMAISATPSSTSDPMLSLRHRCYGLPGELVQNMEDLGIKHIYPWQKNCLLGPGLLGGQKNLVYSAPTGGGKSLVADGWFTIPYVATAVF
jgi:hypothetical protein